MAKLTKQQVMDIVSKRPQGTSPEGVIAALRAQGHQLEGYPSQAEPKQPGALQRVVASQVHQLPIYGGVALQAAAPEAPGVAALLGAAGGRAIQQMVPPDWGGSPTKGPLDAAVQQGWSGATNLAFNQGPQAIAEETRPIREWIAKKSMQLALRRGGDSGKAAAETALSRVGSSGEPVKGMGPGFTGRFVKQLQDRIESLASRQGEALARAKAEGQWHDPREFLKVKAEFLKSKDARAMTQGERSRFSEWVDNLLSDHVKVDPATGVKTYTPIDPETLAAWRTRYASYGKSLYKAADEDEYVAPGEALPKKWAVAVADRTRDMLHTKHPNLIEIDKDIHRLSNLSGPAKELAKKQVKHLLPYVPSVGVGTLAAAATPGNWEQRGLAGLGVGAALSPQGLSNFSLMLTNPNIAPMLTQLLRGGGAVADALQPSTPGTAP